MYFVSVGLFQPELAGLLEMSYAMCAKSEELSSCNFRGLCSQLQGPSLRGRSERPLPIVAGRPTMRENSLSQS